MSEIEECSECGKNFSITEIKMEMPGTKEREDITCPYCKHTYTRRSNGLFQTHPLPEDKQ